MSLVYLIPHRCNFIHLKANKLAFLGNLDIFTFNLQNSLFLAMRWLFYKSLVHFVSYSYKFVHLKTNQLTLLGDFNVFTLDLHGPHLLDEFSLIT